MKSIAIAIWCVIFFAPLVRGQDAPDTLWIQHYGLRGREYGTRILQTSDGGYFAVGEYFINSGWYGSCQVMRLNSSGDTLWTKLYGWSGQNWNFKVTDALLLPDGGIVILWIFSEDPEPAPYPVWDSHLLRLDSQGNALWSKTYGYGVGDPVLQEYFSFVQTEDNGFLLVGRQDAGNGDKQIHLLRTDSIGNAIWARDYGGFYDDGAFDIRRTSDEGYIIAGYISFDIYAPSAPYLMKINSIGDSVWTCITPYLIDPAYLNAVVEDDSGAFIAVGASGPEWISSVCKVSSSGGVVWNRNYPGWYLSRGSSIEKCTNGFILSGQFESGAWILKINELGITLWTREYSNFSSQYANSVILTGDGGYAMIGSSSTFDPGNSDFYIVKTDLDRTNHGLWLLNPSGGETYHLTDTIMVRWYRNGFSGPIAIDFSSDYPSGLWTSLATVAEPDTSILLRCPGPVSTRCRFRLRALEAPFVTVTTADFTVLSSDGYLALVKPSTPTQAILSWNAGVLECPAITYERFRLKNFGNESVVVLLHQEPQSDEFTYSESCDTFTVLAAGQMSACSLLLEFSPSELGSFNDTLFLQSDAINANNGYVEIPLFGTQIRTPSSPQVVIQVQGMDARLSWSPVAMSTGQCTIEPTGYLVFYTPTAGGPFYYHGFTTDTSYIHTRVLQFAIGMFYNVVTTTAPLLSLQQLDEENAQKQLTQIEVLERLSISKYYKDENPAIAR